ncbi:MAG: Transporter [uncultured Sulfurovum sp.]|uniref:Transporter n=1 Tax=uncultured Sulfurovum sp. TaxID=269237 RepID=A0A6S6U318_9BACT|nr:MAG: Transporter [uncultured Sulfurovum sp.]
MLYNVHLVLLLITLLSGCGAGESSSSNTDTQTFVEPSKAEILAVINKIRSQKIDCKNGLGFVGPSQPLKCNPELYEAAYEHSYDLAMTNTFSHDGSGTQYDIAGYNRGTQSYFTERIDDHGYVDYDIIGENIAAGITSLEEVVQRWIESPAHCTNLMNNKFNEMGISIVVNPDSHYGIYWTQELGHRKEVQ